MKTINFRFFKILPFLVLLILFTGSIAKGQDIIMKKNGDEIKAKVEEVLATEIKYRKFENLTGPLYSIAKTEVFMIKYENGSKDVFGDEPVPVVTQPAPGTGIRSISDSDLKPAKSASLLGYVLVAPILGLGITSGAIYDYPKLTIPMGAVATLIGAIGIPLVANGGAKTRNLTGVEGNQGLRIASWISYGLALGDAVTIIGLAIGGYDTSGGPTYAVAALGSVASILMAMDASQTYSQAKNLKIQASIQPTIGTVYDMSGNNYPTIGVRLNF